MEKLGINGFASKLALKKYEYSVIGFNVQRGDCEEGCSDIQFNAGCNTQEDVVNEGDCPEVIEPVSFLAYTFEDAVETAIQYIKEEVLYIAEEENALLDVHKLSTLEISDETAVLIVAEYVDKLTGLVKDREHYLMCEA